MSQWNYLVTAQPPTSVTHALGPLAFISEDPIDVVIACATHLEVCRLRGKAAGNPVLCRCKVHCRISTLQPYRAQGERRDFLVLCTDKRQVVVLRYDLDRSAIVTVALGSLSDASGQPTDQAPLCACDPSGTLAAFYIYEGLVKAVLLDGLSSRQGPDAVQLNDAQRRIRSARVAESRVLDMRFQCGSDGCAPRLCVLHVDHRGLHYFSTWILRPDGPQILTGGMNGDSSDIVCVQTHGGAARMVPLPLPIGGTVILGGQYIAWHDSTGYQELVKHVGTIDVVCVGAAHSTPTEASWLVGCADGSLWMLKVAGKELPGDNVYQVSSIGLCMLGMAVPAKAIVAVGDRIFIASMHSDSQILLFGGTKNRGANKFMVEDTLPNLGPIVDFCIVDPDGHGHSQVATCSGVGRSGTLRVVRVGTGVTEVASLDHAGAVLGLWALGDTCASAGGVGPSSNLLVLSYARGTRVLGVQTASSGEGAQEMAWLPAPGIEEAEQTIFCCEVRGVVLQVTHSGIRAACRPALESAAEPWLAAGSIRSHAAAVAASQVGGGSSVVQVAAAAPGGVLLGLSDGQAMHIQVQPSAVQGGSASLAVVASFQLQGEPACLAVRCESMGTAGGQRQGPLLAAGLWTQQLQVRRLDPKDGEAEFAVAPLPGSRGCTPRSLAFARLSAGDGGRLHLFAGMADGALVSFTVDEAARVLHLLHTVPLGAKPLRLLTFAPPPIPAALANFALVPGRHAGEGLGGVDAPREDHVFVTGDRPTIVHARSSSGGHFGFAAVNLRKVRVVAEFQGSAGPLAGCFAFIADKRLVLGMLEAVQRVHVRTIKLNDSPHRIAFLPTANAYAVACQPPPAVEGLGQISIAPQERNLLLPQADMLEPRFGSLRFYSASTLELLQKVELQPQESVSAMAEVTFEGDPIEYLALGTVFLLNSDPEPQCGRVLLYAKSCSGRGKPFYAIVGDALVQGAPYALAAYKGMLLGTVNNSVHLWRLCRASGKLEPVCSNYGSCILALGVDALGDHILVGDLMRSVMLLRYKTDEPALAEVGRDAVSAWTTAVLMLSEDIFLCADDSHNIIVLKRSDESAAKRREEHARGGPNPKAACLERVGLIHSGHFLNRMKRGGLVELPATSQMTSDGSGSFASDEGAVGAGAGGSGAGTGYAAGSFSSCRPVAQAVWASVDGAIGLVISLPSEESFVRLSLIQDAVLPEIRSVAGLSHSSWRDAWGESSRGTPHVGFVDGDVVEGLLDLTRPQQQTVVDRLVARGVPMPGGVEGLLREVEELAQLH